MQRQHVPGPPYPAELAKGHLCVCARQESHAAPARASMDRVADRVCARHATPARAWTARSSRNSQRPSMGRNEWPADGDRNAALSNANKSFADHRVTGDPPCSSPRRTAASTQILESTNNHKPCFVKHRTGFCLLGFISHISTGQRPSMGRIEWPAWTALHA
jgi:hypothetical protein